MSTTGSADVGVPTVTQGAELICVTDVIAHPLTFRLDEPAVTSWGAYSEVSIVLIEVRTDAGLTGIGECLARFAPHAYAEAIKTLYRPMLIGRSVFDIGQHSLQMRRALSGRSGGMSSEAMAGIDIALWDIVGKAARLPLYKIFGGVGRTEVEAYASSVGWLDDEKATARIESLVASGFRAIKLKIGHPVDMAVRRAALARRVAGDGVKLYADANWAYSVSEALEVGKALEANGFSWFEEPIVPEDIEGYRKLGARFSVPLAAGESDFNAAQSCELISGRIVDVIQPNAARHGGITGVRRTVALASSFNVSYAPHVGFSGIVCEAASLHLAAAADNLLTFEVVTGKNPFREGLADLAPASASLRDGRAQVPTGWGLGLEIDWDFVARLRTA